MIPLSVVAALVCLTGCGITKEYHQTYAFPPDGRIYLETVTGGAQIVGWDRNEVQVSVIAKSNRSEDLQNTEIRIETDADSMRLWTDAVEVSAGSDAASAHPGGPANVQYILSVPRGISFERIEVFDSSLDITGVRGSIRARVRNGDIRASFDELGDTATTVSLETLGGAISVRFPYRPDVRLDAHSSRGTIESDFGIPMRSTLPNGGEFSDVREIVGAGRVRVRLYATDGSVTIRQAPPL